MNDVSTILTSVWSLVGALLAIILPLVGVWLKAHQTQVDAATAQIKDVHVRAVAVDVCRWLEQDPDQKLLSGLTQRRNGIERLASLVGVPASQSTVALDSAYQGLVLAGQIIPHVEAAVEPAAPFDVESFAVKVGAALASTFATLPAPAPAVPAPAGEPSHMGPSAEPPAV